MYIYMSIPTHTLLYDIFPLGYRCSSAGILKQLQLKNESYPFDWLVSRLPVVQHCLETNFQYFIEDISANYTQRNTVTQHYEHDGTVTFICDETVIVNTYYDTYPISVVNYSIPLQRPHDTYAHNLLMNHHNIFTEKDFEYYQRCIQRFNLLLTQPTKPTVYLYIHPALSVLEYEMHKMTLVDEFKAFQLFLQNKYPNTYPKGLILIPVKTQHPYPITDVYPCTINTLYEGFYISDFYNPRDPVNNPEVSISVVYMNKDFIDAGEIFMRNAYIETEQIMNYIKSKIYDPNPPPTPPPPVDPNVEIQ